MNLIPIRTVESNQAGALSYFEGGRDLPFEIKRIYYIHGVAQGVSRGGHAHKTLRQLLFCPYGSVCVALDDGLTRREVLLDRPDKGLLIEPVTWRDMEWRKTDSVLCVAASDFYDESDYIRDYAAFLQFVKEREV